MSVSRAHQELDAANRLIFVKSYETAELLIEQLSAQPQYRHDAIIHLRRIELATKLGHIDKLWREYDALAAKNPEEAIYKISCVLAEQHGEKISPVEATARYQEIIRVHGAHPAAYFGIAFAMEAQGNFERAQFNYEQCVKIDPNWFPGYFGLSQICYHRGDDKKGDHYFFMFESVAPYNVYGNFDTHRKLSNEFLDQGKYAEAEAAISTLSEWWVDNKGVCPPEILIYEAFSIGRIADHAGDAVRCRLSQDRGIQLANVVMADQGVHEGVLYFIAKTLEEFSENDLAFKVYKRILSIEGAKPEVVQKIGGQFLALGEYHLAKELFDAAYETQPDNPEVRFCLLVANLRIANVVVEEYLIGKERMKQLASSPSDKVELLSLLHSLLAKFQGDPEVHAAIGEVYLRLGNIERAMRHYSRMLGLDPKSRATRLSFATFAMQHGDQEEAFKIITGLETGRSPREEREDLLWLKSSYYYRKGDFTKSQGTLERILEIDPWNVSYLVQNIINLSSTEPLPEEFRVVDSVVKKLAIADESVLMWDEFDQKTKLISEAHAYRLAYGREKLRFLYAHGDQISLRRLVRAARQYDPNRATYDFLRLLNTNFDGPSIYWALGILFKEIWQLETSGMWFEQILIFPGADASYCSMAYLELADCYCWRGVHLPKAIEYARMALDIGDRSDGRALTVLSHALLRSGQVREAQDYLEQASREVDPEAVYLKGLLLYRNGDQHAANQVWKPLLTVRSDSLRFHNIKQEIMKYYFEKVPYQGIS